MKLKRITRLFGILIILSMLMVALPAAPALAVNNIEVYPEEGSIGQEIEITGENFGATSSDRMVAIYFAEEDVSISPYKYIDTDVETYENVGWADIGLLGASDEGEFSTTFEVPDELNDGDDDEVVESGTYYIYVCIVTGTTSDTAIRAKAEFEVIAGEIELDEEEGIVGTLLEITGSGFPAEEDISIEYHNGSTTVDVDIEDGDDETDDDGEFETVIRIPESTTGDHTLTVTVEDSEAEAEFTVVPDILLNTQSGKAGDSITVSGTGFGKRAEIEVWFNDNIGVATETASSTGSFTATFTIPSGLAASIYDVDVEDGTSTATAKFTLTVEPSSTPEPEPEPEPEAPTPPPSSTSLSISPTSGKVNDLVTLIGMGFKANTQITVQFAGEAMATPTSTEQGVFSAAFYVPAGNNGAQTITASDGTNTSEVSFAVESVAPARPTSPTPEAGAKLKSPGTFDWDDVTDDSLPVTYILQIATDKDFDNVVLEKEKIEESTYSLTEAEELELANRETTSYYWRIKAVDGASNEGAWTDGSEFYAAGSFNFPKWAIYTLLAFGAVIIFGVGYWLGRRTAFYY